jgi:hypothetical protein
VTETDETTPNMTDTMIRKFADFARQVAWKRPDLKVLKAEYDGEYPPIAGIIQDHLERSDRRGKLILPDFRAFGNGTVGLFTDYGGESNDAKFLTYSTLACAWGAAYPFVEMMSIVRTRHGLGSKEIAFKDFGMGQITRALPNYLKALDAVPGFLLTLAIDKRLSTVFGPEGKEGRQAISRALTDAGLGGRKPAVNEKLLRIVHITAFLTGLLAHDGQKVFWMTDHDAIVANPEMHAGAGELYRRILPMYSRDGHSISGLDCFLPDGDPDTTRLDLLSCADVAAGAVEQYLTRGKSTAAEDIRVKQGCDLVLRWLSYDGIGLKKMNVIARPGEKDAIDAVTLEFMLQDPPATSIMFPLSV